MSSHPRNSNTLELRLQVRYHGLKATQYFTKFTADSQAVVREDFTVLKLPHPKKENMYLLSHGCVECVWQNAQSNRILRRDVALRSENPDKVILDRLSIANVVYKEIWHGRTPKQGNGLKRPVLPGGYRERDSPVFAPPSWGAPALPTSSGQESSERPSKYARVVLDDPLSYFSASLPPKPPPSTNTNTNANTNGNTSLNPKSNPIRDRRRRPQTQHAPNANAASASPHASMQRKTATRPPTPPSYFPRFDSKHQNQRNSDRMKQEEVEHALHSRPSPPLPSPILSLNPGPGPSSSSTLGAWANEVANANAAAAAPASRKIPLSMSLSSSTSSLPFSSKQTHRLVFKKPRPPSGSTDASESFALAMPLALTTTSASVSAKQRSQPQHSTSTPTSLRKPSLTAPASDARTSNANASKSKSSTLLTSAAGLPSALPPKPSIGVPPLKYDSPGVVLLPVSNASERQRQSNSTLTTGTRKASDTHAPSASVVPISVSTSKTSSTPISRPRPVKSSSGVNANDSDPVWRVKEEPIEVSIPPPVDPPPAPAPLMPSVAEERTESDAMVIDENEPDTRKADRVVKGFLKSLHIKMESQHVPIPLPPPSDPPPPPHTPPPPPLLPPSTPKAPSQALQNQRISNSPSIPWDLISVALSSASIPSQSVTSGKASASSSKPSRTARTGSTGNEGHRSELTSLSLSVAGTATVDGASKSGPATQTTKSRSSNSVLPTPPPSATATGDGDSTHSNLVPSTAVFPPSLGASSGSSDQSSHSIIQSQPSGSKVGVPLMPRTSTSSVSPPVVDSSSLLSSSSSHPQPPVHTKIKSQERQEEVPIHDCPNPDHELEQYNFQLQDIMAKAQKAALQAQRLPASSPPLVGTRAHLSSLTRSNTIAHLTREVWDIKRQVTALVAREGVVIEELRTLEAKWIPECVRIGDDVDAERALREKERVMQARIEKLEKDLENECMLREEAEHAIQDVRRECKAPFVVPSLLDAFVDLSKLTTKAMRPPAPEPATTVSKTDLGSDLKSTPTTPIVLRSKSPEAEPLRAWGNMEVDDDAGRGWGPGEVEASANQGWGKDGEVTTLWYD